MNKFNLLAAIFAPSYYAGYANFTFAAFFSVVIDILILAIIVLCGANFELISSKQRYFLIILFGFGILAVMVFAGFVAKRILPTKDSKFIVGNSIWIGVCNLCAIFFLFVIKEILL